ncbi:uncharacterized protein LOC105397166 isoform X1 [Plutella xylostella]|uniref:uncharacterized protein LOC105397166 isoform X2 n=1 Tax=Plutella xylostella TaxID=51655 RepID=UPI00203229A4|nr:uncharacterized protein LOC105397166 isoform X2 [Plutella xylostella]XP_048487948.1 uncharacterized protein LOC105397166 isoform X1 [Plutella xylostella]
MDAMQEKLKVLRDERAAREKARLEKLRQLNLQKYKKEELPIQKSKPAPAILRKTNSIPIATKSTVQHTNLIPLRKSMAPSKVSELARENKTTAPKKEENPKKTIPAIIRKTNSIPLPTKATVAPQSNAQRKSMAPIKVAENAREKAIASKKVEIHTKIQLNPTIPKKTSSIPLSRKSIIPHSNAIPLRKSMAPAKVTENAIRQRKSMAPVPQKTTTESSHSESVFDRLYKPKMAVEKPHSDQIQKLQSDSKFRDKIVRNAGLISNKRHTVFEPKSTVTLPVRRSISAVHFKRISKNELPNCMHKWSSSENLSKVHLKDIDEDIAVNQDKVVSAVKSERKKVKFQKPVYMNFNTPTPDELQSRLKSWLQKRGKSIDSYHHLQCFGLHHLTQSAKDFKAYDDENKENIAVESDSDNDSFCDAMNNKTDDNKWRRASYVSTAEFDETKDTLDSEEVVSEEIGQDEDQLLVGALNDLAELLKEGFDWEQCARWLRAIRVRFPAAAELGAYWECRAALEERRGNLPDSLHCWEEAIVNGTERSVVEANLDQLLDKFMQLKISPHSAKKQRPVNPRLIDVKNVFKSTIIRFAVQQAKIRQSVQPDPSYTVTPVRRSNRLSTNKTPGQTPRSARQPLVQICASLSHIDPSLAGKTTFVPNGTILNTP